MGLFLPPAVSISKFTGGYKSVSEYTDLGDTETNDAENTVYGPNGTIDSRSGSLRLYNQKLYSSGAATVARPITGHYFFDKLGNTSTYHIVAAGDSLYNYTSATASAIATGLTDNSNTFWNFVQIQDPRSPSDDMVIGTNGVDVMKVWTGSATATNLSAFTSATQVPIAKYLLNYKERVYAFNIVDASDVDAPVKVMRTGFGGDGAANPHRFTETFYVGGSNKQGDLRGGRILNESIYFFTRKSSWRFSPGTGDLGDLQQLEGSVGVLAPFSLVDCGNFLMFLSERGVFAFDGSSFIHLSEKVDNELFANANLSQLEYSKAEFNKRDNQYILYFAEQGSDRNNRALIYDLRIKAWQPPVTGRQISFISTFDNSNGIERVIYGDYLGYLYEDGTGVNDGLATGYNGTASSGTVSTLTDATASFPTSGDGLAGMMVRIIGGTGVGQWGVISSNNGTTVTIETPWALVPDATSQYSIGAVDAYWRSKDLDFGAQDLVKLFRHFRLRVREEGNFNLLMHYIVDFNDVAQATLATIRLLDDGFAWGLGVWGQARWGRKDTIRRKISLRSTNAQSTTGTHLALRFSNQRANQSFRISGFDVELMAAGKR